MQDIIFTFISSWTTYTSIRKACPFSRLPWDKPIRTGSKVVLAIRSRFIHCAWGAFRFSWETNDERVEIISEFGRTAARIPGTDNAIEAKWWKCILIERTNERAWQISGARPTDKSLCTFWSSFEDMRGTGQTMDRCYEPCNTCCQSGR